MVPRSLFGLAKLFEGGLVAVFTALLEWGVLSTAKTCQKECCKKEFQIKVDLEKPSTNPFNAKGYCSCKSTPYVADSGTLFDRRYTKLSMKAQLLLVYLFSNHVPPKKAWALIADDDIEDLNFSYKQTVSFYKKIRSWITEHNNLTAHQFGGLADNDAEGPGIAEVDLTTELPARKQHHHIGDPKVRNPKKAKSHGVQFDEFTPQTQYRLKQLLAMQTGSTVAKQTHVERWVCGCVDIDKEEFSFMILPEGRCSRTKENLCNFVIDSCRPCTLVITDCLKAYSPKTLANHGLLSMRVNHDKREWVSGKRDTGGRDLNTQKIESIWNRVRKFLAVYNLQKQQCPAKRRPGEEPPLYYYLHEFKWRFDKKVGQTPKNAFEKLLDAIALVQKRKGGICGRVRDTVLYPY
jgi:hypothetical protein